MLRPHFFTQSRGLQVYYVMTMSPLGDTIAAEMAKGRNFHDPLSYTRNRDLEKSSDLAKVIQAASREGDQVTNPGPGTPELDFSCQTISRQLVPAGREPPPTSPPPQCV